jgi:hypothetical protein
MDEME